MWVRIQQMKYLQFFSMVNEKDDRSNSLQINWIGKCYDKNSETKFYHQIIAHCKRSLVKTTQQRVNTVSVRPFCIDIHCSLQKRSWFDSIGYLSLIKYSGVTLPSLHSNYKCHEIEYFANHHNILQWLRQPNGLKLPTSSNSVPLHVIPRSWLQYFLKHHA